MSPYRNCFGKGLNSAWGPLAKFISVQHDPVPTTGREPRQYEMLLILCRRAQKGADAAPGTFSLLSSEEIQPVSGAPTPLPFLLSLPAFFPSHTLLWDLTSSHRLTGVIMHAWHQAESPKVAARQQGGCWIRHLLARWICRREESNWMVQQSALFLSHLEVDFP